MRPVLYLVKFLSVSVPPSFKGWRKVELASLTSEGRILLSLSHGKHTYRELRFETGLSDRWLTIKLEGLEASGIIEKSGRWYGLAGRLDVSVYELSLYMRSQAKRIARELARLRHVRTIILFGGVAQNNADEHSDLDMIIVLNDPTDKAKREVISVISKLELRYHLTVEPLILSEKDFLDNVYSHEGGIIYGIAEGSEVLIDKTARLEEISRGRVEEIKRSHNYLKEEGMWLRAK